MKYPLAYFLTWTTYGTWLHGDERGSFDCFGNYIPPNPAMQAAAAAAMAGDPIILSDAQRKLIDARLVELCQLGNWILHARNVRTNHVHAVVSAQIDGKVLRGRLKAGCSITLSEHVGLVPTGKNGATKWWTEEGNVEEIWTELHLQNAVIYVNEGQ